MSSKTTAIVVPGNGAFEPDGAYRITARCRRLVAEAERLAERCSPRAVVFSGWAPEGSVSEAEQMREAWRGPELELVVEPTATITAENAARTLPLLLERGIERALVVCTPLHLYRARWFFRRLYAAHGVEARFRAAPVAPTLHALGWELVALTARSRQLHAAEAELRRR
ncbi:MAG TPA: YdcF family protein [Gaiellaceae bacterium]|nr:YdcF family protein [Gaiellaceae bacterium]